MSESFTLTINGAQQTVDSDPERTLLEVLREDLEMTGTKYGCGEGRCRACTVLADGKPLLACVTPLSKLNGQAITTIEGFSEEDGLHPVQEAFLQDEAFQCGFCTPGFVLQTAALLRHNPKPTDEEIVEWLNPSLCRCCSYLNIMNAARRAAGRSEA
jgi:aerobic carbon-monoxide dehydrogenase small subunit